jgi:glycosyltransferase involved in cell wall biosynthesis
LEGEGFDVAGLDTVSLGTTFEGADVCVTQLIWPSVAFAARRHGVRLVLDSYDPMLLEELEAFADKEPRGRRARNRRTLAKTRLGLQLADAVVCANERQRDLWLGALMALDRITPVEYALDPTLRGLVNLVPFGLSDAPPERTGPGLRETLDLPSDSLLMLWGGGVWNWFDPLTLLRAMHLLLPAYPDLHLAFVGIRHPNESVPDAEMAGKAVALAAELGMLGVNVHVNYGWTPYDQRQNNLLDADLGVSTHFEQLETRFAFRTRMLDYLWAGLPIVTTEGDSFADLVAGRQLGVVVPPNDVDALAAGLRTVLDDPALREAMRTRCREVAGEFTWTRVAESLDETIQSVLRRPLRTSLAGAALANYAGATMMEVFVEKRAGEVGRSVSRRVRRKLMS